MSVLRSSALRMLRNMFFAKKDRFGGLLLFVIGSKLLALLVVEVHMHMDQPFFHIKGDGKA